MREKIPTIGIKQKRFPVENPGKVRISRAFAIGRAFGYWQSTCWKTTSVRFLDGAFYRVEWAERMFIRSLQQGKRFLKILIGFTLLALGVVMILTPGPGWLTILLGLGVLAAEFVWARRLLDRLKEQGGRIRASVFPRTDRSDRAA